MKRTVVLAGLLLLGCSDSVPHLKNGEPAPAFELARLGADPLAFPADLQGQIVAIRFWADWCPFCKSEMRDIEPVYRAYREQGLRVLAVNVRQDAETAARFIEGLHVTYDVLLDEEGTVARAYGVIGLPSTFFVDRDGKLASRVLGESTPDVLEYIVKELL